MLRQFFFSTFACLLIFQAFSQSVTIEIGTTEIGVNQTFSITATIQNERIKEYSGFPEINGFRKLGTSSSSSTSIINGRVSSSQSITQNYQPLQKGEFTLKPFQIKINGKEAKSNGTKITVGETVQRKKWDPFADFWGFGKQDQTQEYLNVKEDAFFALSTNKDEVYVGEGINLNLAFYVALSNKASMEFYEVSDQLTEILKTIKPANCWEENFEIESIKPVIVTIQGKQYRQYKLYEAVYFPLNTEEIIFPSVGLKMIKYKVAKNPVFFGRNKQEDFKTFYTKRKNIQVKELPDHPLKEQVNVGVYQLEENVNERKFQTGKSFTLNYKIKGKGNISAIKEPFVSEIDDFVVYPPNIQQNITRANGSIVGSKNFEFFVEPQEPGEFNLKDYFKWVYFNTAKEKYDTLFSNVSLNITGESKKNDFIASSSFGGVYDLIEKEDNKLESIQPDYTIRYYVLIGIILSLLLPVYFWVKPKSQP